MKQTIKDFRESAGLTQEELAEKLNLSLSGWRNIERGRSVMRTDVLYRLARILGETPETVLHALTNVTKLE